jgi:hypothetical protein
VPWTLINRGLNHWFCDHTLNFRHRPLWESLVFNRALPEYFFTTTCFGEYRHSFGSHKDPFPWWLDKSQQRAVPIVDDLLMDPGKAPISFEHMIANDGLLHTIDNASKDLNQAMASYKDREVGCFGDCSYR